MKYFIGQLEETNGEYEHYITVRFALEDKVNPSDALENVARSWYDSDVEEQDERYFSFKVSYACAHMAVRKYLKPFTGKLADMLPRHFSENNHHAG